MEKIPENLVLSGEDILYLSNAYLARLTATDASNFSAWTGNRQISERKLTEIAERLGMSKGDLLAALDAKRQVRLKVQEANAKAQRLIQFLSQQQEEEWA